MMERSRRSQLILHDGDRMNRKRRMITSKKTEGFKALWEDQSYIQAVADLSGDAGVKTCVNLGMLAQMRSSL